MLREIGNRDNEIEVTYLLPRYRSMPRTMLRYAIEKFSEEERLGFLHGTVWFSNFNQWIEVSFSFFEAPSQ